MFERAQIKKKGAKRLRQDVCDESTDGRIVTCLLVGDVPSANSNSSRLARALHVFESELSENLPSSYVCDVFKSPLVSVMGWL